MGRSKEGDKKRERKMHHYHAILCYIGLPAFTVTVRTGGDGEGSKLGGRER